MVIPIAIAAVILTVVLSLIMIAVLRQRSISPPPVRRSSQMVSPYHPMTPMLCPKCHTPMRSGHTTVERGIAWCDGDKKIPGRMSFSWLKAVLPNTLNNGISLKLNAAWRCDQCSIVVIDHSSLNKPPDDRA